VELTLAAALIAGLVSFISPCVLPVVPAYLGQLGVVTAAAAAPVGAGAAAVAVQPSRWRALPHALAFVIGFGIVFTIFGLTFYVLRPLFELPLVRIGGGLLIVLLGLNLMGVVRLRLLSRSWTPFRRFGEAPLGGAAAHNPLAALVLGAVFAAAHTPCIGPTLGAILGLSLHVGAAPEVVALLVAYSIGLGAPFVILGLALDSSARLTRPFLRHGRAIELIGGALVVLIGLAIAFDLLSVFAQTFRAFWPMV